MHDELLNLLKSALSTENKKVKLSVLGVGSDLRADDAAGLLVVEALSKKMSKNIQLLYGATAPESLTGEIKKFAPTHLIVVDCADMKEKPGTINLIKEENISGLSFSTHTLPLAIILDYLQKSFKYVPLVIGIQPKNLEFCGEVSGEVKKACKEVVETLLEATKNL